MPHLEMQLTGHRRFDAVTAPDPDIPPGAVLVEVAAANLCPTDVKKWDDRELGERLRGRGLVLGHEFAGTIVATGDGVIDLAVRDRVTVDPVLRCGSCPSCASGRPEFCTALLGLGAAAGDPVACAPLGGGFAERVVVPAGNVLPLPDSVDFAAGSLVEPLADVMNSLETARLLPGDTAAVIGLGPMGLLHVEALLDAGIEVVGVDLREDRLAVARSLGAAAVLPSALGEADVVFVVAGGGGYVPSVQLGLERLAPGGRLVLFSSAPSGTLLPFDSNRVHYRRQQVLGVVGFERRHALEAIGLLSRGAISVDVLRTPSVPLRDLQTAFEGVADPGVLKAAIEFGS